ncbi:uncharacterized protein N7473_009792 [Penicillium subrubescens]|uniref:Glucosamine 6-phosphate N-acetyltransferase n=1 Tax=Penicillium subrubescens TaxID=1316194 RepID=A0A1Q5TCB6_9EURO|nr:uncharacterized protein N7473_009792 [Penicillium subrubescens]KAJ5882906.1 hypothetical protein N7473_009792 [Penicillium subrubescens]OKO97858.1 hypothetical protein PENSUB_9784 [Penicillium subrubescens]
MATQKPTGITFTTSIQPPPGPTSNLVLPNDPSASLTHPPIFNDAMKVRVRVFVDEQHCSADAEIDADDARSWQWVIYASSPSENTTTSTSTATSTPVAVIRLVPPPQPPHELLTHPTNTNTTLPAYDWSHEPCIKLTRVAVLPEYRGFGLGRRLVETALEWATEHAGEIDAAAGELARQLSSQKLQDKDEGQNSEGGLEAWRGLVLVHAQVDVERMYSGLGFVRDEGLGRWDEEGIEHVGMFRRVEVR